MNVEKLKEIIDLDNRRKALEEEIRDIAVRRECLESEMLEAFQESGVNSMKVNGQTIYLARKLYVSPKDDRASAAQYLKSIGLGDYVSEGFNLNSISAYVREIDKQGEALPQGFTDQFRVSECFKLQSKKG